MAPAPAWAIAFEHHRSDGRAGGRRCRTGQPVLDHLQRGDLQLRRAPGGADRARPLLPLAPDTEVIMHLFQGSRSSCVDRLNGMFAFAIWTGRVRCLPRLTTSASESRSYTPRCLTRSCSDKSRQCWHPDSSAPTESCGNCRPSFQFAVGDKTCSAACRDCVPANADCIRRFAGGHRQYWNADFTVATDRTEGVGGAPIISSWIHRLQLRSGAPVGFLPERRSPGSTTMPRSRPVSHGGQFTASAGCDGGSTRHHARLAADPSARPPGCSGRKRSSSNSCRG